VATLGETVSRILNDLDRGSDQSSRVTTAIVEAIDHYAAQRFAFNTTKATAVTQPSTEYLALPNDFVEVDRLRMNTSTDEYLLDEKTAEWLDENFDSSNTGKPVAYAIQDRELRIWPIPDASYTVLMYYHCLLPEVSLSADSGVSNAWLTEGFQVIYNHAMADLLETYHGGPEAFQTAERHRIREAQAVRELERRANREQAPGELKAWL
jgi:hypothetical protein